MVRGAGTLLNTATVLLGSGLGVALRGRLPARTRDTVTDALGLVTLVLGGLDVAALSDPPLVRAVGDSAPLLVVLGALLLGGIGGSLLRVEERLEAGGAWLQRRLTGGGPGESGPGESVPGGGDSAVSAVAPHGAAADDEAGVAARARFVEGFVTSSLVFVVGPLTVLGSLSDGLGHGIDQLALKSTLDGFASLAFAASLGWGVAASAVSIAVVQGLLTVLGAVLGTLVPAAGLAALTATGGILLLGVGLRLLAVKAVPVGDLLPALVVAPLLTSLVQALR